jgi:hypothetical protein
LRASPARSSGDASVDALVRMTTEVSLTHRFGRKAELRSAGQVRTPAPTRAHLPLRGHTYPYAGVVPLALRAFSVTDS